MVPELLKGIGGTNKRKISDPPSLRKQGFSIVIGAGVIVLVLVVDDDDEHDCGRVASWGRVAREAPAQTELRPT